MSITVKGEIERKGLGRHLGFGWPRWGNLRT